MMQMTKLRSFFVFMCLFFIVLLPRIFGKIPSDMLVLCPLSVYLFFSHLGRGQCGSVYGVQRKLLKAWLWFTPFFAYTLIQSFFVESIYWIQWGGHMILIAYVLPRLSLTLEKRELSWVFLAVVSLLALSIIMEVFGPAEVKDSLYRLTRAERQTMSYEEMARHFMHRASGLVSDIPGAGGVLCLSLMVLTSFLGQSGKVSGNERPPYVVTLMVFSCAGIAIFFTARTWIGLYVVFLTVTLIMFRRLSLILILVCLTLSIQVLQSILEHESTKWMWGYVMSTAEPLLHLEIQEAGGYRGLMGGYERGSYYWDYGLFTQVFGTGISSRFEDVGTDIGWMRLLIGVGAMGTVILVLGHLGLLISLVRDIHSPHLRATICSMLVVQLVYAFKGNSLYGLIVTPFYFFAVTVLASGHYCPTVTAARNPRVIKSANQVSRMTDQPRFWE